MRREELQRRPQAGDVPEPVEGDACEAGSVLQGSGRNRPQGDRACHQMCNGLPRAAAPFRVAQTLGPTRRRQPRSCQETGDDQQPGEGHGLLHMAVAAAEEQDQRRHERGRGQNRVLESAEAEHASHRLSSGETRAPQRPVVHREAAGRMRRRVDAEACHYGPRRQCEGETGSAVDPGDGAHGEHVPEIRHDLRREAHRQPDAVEAPDGADHVPVAGRMGDGQHPRGVWRVQRDDGRVPLLRQRQGRLR